MDLYHYVSGSSIQSEISPLIERRLDKKADSYGYFAVKDITARTLLMTCPAISWFRFTTKAGEPAHHQEKFKWAWNLRRLIREHKNKQDLQLWQELYPRTITPEIRSQAKKYNSDMSDDQLLTYLKVARNIHGDEATGYLYNEYSFINHACCCNIVVNFHPLTKKLKVWAMQDIKAGTEITNRYGIDKNDFQSEYQFTCQCDMCQGSVKEEDYAQAILDFTRNMPLDKKSDCWCCWNQLPLEYVCCPTCKQARYCNSECQTSHQMLHTCLKQCIKAKKKNKRRKK